MAHKQFGIQTTGVEKTARALDSIGGRGADARPAWPFVFDVLRADTEHRFDSRGEGTWPPLKASTIASKRAKGQDVRIMRASGALHKSLTAERGKGSLRRKSKLQMRFGSTLFYARFQQEGTKSIKPRRILDADTDVTRRIVDILETYVAKGEITIRGRRR